MSTLIVEVCTVDQIEDHPNADRMKIATIKGWKVCIGYSPEENKAEFEVGEKCIYLPVGSVLPDNIANAPDHPEKPGRLNVRKYLKMLPKVCGVRPEGGVVAAARLRGYPSYGLLMKLTPEEKSWDIGTNVADYFGITKYEPPPESSEGDSEKQSTSFYRYSGIEHFGNYPDAFDDCEEIVITEKIHGKSARLGLVLENDEWTFMAGSHGVRRREVDAKGRPSEFWLIFSQAIKDLLVFIRDDFEWNEAKYSIIIFGELYGSSVQDLTYGLANGEKQFRAFDIAINGRFLDFCDKQSLLRTFEIPTVPVLYRGRFDRKIVEELTNGPTTICEESDIKTAFKGREGVVIQPVKEQPSRKVPGRLILKSVSVDYLSRKNGTEAH